LIINREERNERLRREIDRLPQELRQVANLRFIDDIAVSKISDLLKIDNFSRVSSMVKKAKEILQKNLGQDFLN
jgi:DNA-directed RNA polymerase specialized sigma24 family protein